MLFTRRLFSASSAAGGLCRRTPLALSPVTLYSTSHEWITWDRDAKTAVLGVTECRGDEQWIGDILSVEVKGVGDKVAASENFGRIKSTVPGISVATTPLVCHVTGTVAEVNPAVQAKPDIVNVSPEHDGWMLKLKDVEAVPETLMTRAKYDELVATI